MIRRFLLGSAFAVLVGTVIGADPVPVTGVPVPAPCPTVCNITPQKQVVHRTAYAVKCESHCLQSVSLVGFLKMLCGQDCGPVSCDPPRSKARLVKWDVTEERMQLKCSVDPCPIVAPGPIAPPGPLNTSPFIIITPKK